MLKNIIIIFFLVLTNFTTVNAELKNPNSIIKPDQVIKIQLTSLMKNDYPSKDNGIEQTWKFAHPNNQKYTGPLEKFKSMMKSDSYSMLLNLKDYQIKQIYISEDVATFEVTILDENKKYFKFKWQVEKFKQEGPLKDCWLTTAVSQPIPLGSSI